MEVFRRAVGTGCAKLDWYGGIRHVFGRYCGGAPVGNHLECAGISLAVSLCTFGFLYPYRVKSNALCCA